MHGAPVKSCLPPKVCSNLVHQPLPWNTIQMFLLALKKEFQSIVNSKRKHYCRFCFYWSTPQFHPLFCHWTPFVLCTYTAGSPDFFFAQYTNIQHADIFISQLGSVWIRSRCLSHHVLQAAGTIAQQLLQHGGVAAVNLHAAEAFFFFFFIPPGRWPTIAPPFPTHHHPEWNHRRHSVLGLTTHSLRAARRDADGFISAKGGIDREHSSVLERRKRSSLLVNNTQSSRRLLTRRLGSGVASWRLFTGPEIWPTPLLQSGFLFTQFARPAAAAWATFPTLKLWKCAATLYSNS